MSGVRRFRRIPGIFHTEGIAGKTVRDARWSTYDTAMYFLRFFREGYKYLNIVDTMDIL